jgi:tetratricopeptide (TPR) repeat protein
VIISAELVDARTRRQIWGDRFRRRSDDLLSVQDQIIRAIAVGLQLRLTNEQQEAINTRPTESGEAYELYMRGRYYWNQGTPEALKKADEYFERAAGLDPKYALAIAGCAACHAFGANYDEPPSASMPKAKEVALAALKQNDKLASVHLVLARVAWMYDWDFATAERKFKRALELDAGDPVAHAQYGEFLAEMGREGEAVAEIDRARTLDPSSPRINQTAGLVYYYQRRYDPAITQLNAALKLAPKNVLALEGLGMVYEQQNLRPEAIEQYLKARLSADSQTAYLHDLKGAYARGGWKAFWRQELSSWQDRAAKGYVPASKFAEINLRLEDHKQALFWLAKAYDERDGRLVALKIDPLYDPLRGEDRFKDILKRVEAANSER